jgi:hypothetical protein
MEQVRRPHLEKPERSAASVASVGGGKSQVLFQPIFSTQPALFGEPNRYKINYE